MTRSNRWMGFAAVSALVIGLLAVRGPASLGQAPAKPAPVTWAYQTIMGTAAQSNDETLNRFGAGGWELFIVQQEGNGAVRFVLKRQISR